MNENIENLKKWINEGFILQKKKNSNSKTLVKTLDNISENVTIFYKDVQIGYKKTKIFFIDKIIKYINLGIIYNKNFSTFKLGSIIVINQFSYDEGIKLINDGTLDSDRLRNLVHLGNKCSIKGCDCVGIKFLVTIHRNGGVHIDLYTKENILMNIDHIYPKSKGGLNRLDNYQLMCEPHNTEKGATVENKIYNFNQFISMKNIL